VNEPKYKTYLFEYPYNGDRWGFEIMATSPEDAVARFKQIPWGQYSGELVHSIEVKDGGALSHLFRWLGGK
jgi:hypothetical protein